MRYSSSNSGIKLNTWAFPYVFCGNPLYLFLMFLFAVTVFAQPQIPNLTKYATDQTGTLSTNEIDRLNQNLLAFEDSTSNQLIFLMISSLNGYPLERYAYDVVEKNKVGQKGRDNGVLLLVVKNDRKIRIEVGYGLEGPLPDALASSIIRNEMAPYFRKNNYFAGIASGIISIQKATKGEYKGDTRRRKNRDDSDGEGFGSIITFIVFFIIFIVSRFGRRGGRGGGIFYVGGFGGGGGFSSGGGGGFGGFSGGGGGFGGGGSSGGW